MKQIADLLTALTSRRRVFVSYASEDRDVAERVALSLRGRGIAVFLDKDDLPAGGDYDSRICGAIEQSSGMVFLVSPASVRNGRYTLTELKFARQKWPHPKGRVLPVLVAETPPQDIPAYLGAVTLLRPQGNVAAEVSAEVNSMFAGGKRAIQGVGAAGAVAACAIAFFSVNGPKTAPTVQPGAGIYVSTSGPAEPASAQVGGLQPQPSGPHGGALAVTATFPQRLDLKFSLEAASGDNPNLHNDQITLAVRTPPQDNERQQLALQDGGFYLINIETPRSTAPFIASATRRVRNAFVSTQALPATAICLHRAKELPTVAVKNHAILRCREGDQPCGKFDDADPGWLAIADTCQKRSPAALPLTTRFAALFLSEAWAATGRVWTVPSLESLIDERSQNRLKDGFTTFKISAEKLNVDADAMSLDLRVDDTPVLIEGLPADMQRRRLNPDAPFAMTFALQNLDFNGRHAGCDRIEAKLLLYKEGEPAGQPIVLPLQYAAMRDVGDTAIVTDRGKFVWSAKYELARPRDHLALTQEDWRLFLQSAPLVDRERIEKARDAFSALGLVYNDGERDYPVVGILRPPLTGNSFGLALGLVQPTGQIRFTFPKPVAESLKAFARAARQRNAAARNLIDENPALFIEKSETSRLYACAPAG